MDTLRLNRFGDSSGSKEPAMAFDTNGPDCDASSVQTHFPDSRIDSRARQLDTIESARGDNR